MRTSFLITSLLIGITALQACAPEPSSVRDDAQKVAKSDTANEPPKQEPEPRPTDPTPVANEPAPPVPEPIEAATPSTVERPKPKEPDVDLAGEERIALSPQGEHFQHAIAGRLRGAKYMEGVCRPVDQWGNWRHFPMKLCRYKTSGQTAEVLMLNPGPRRLTQWIEDACTSFAKNLVRCMHATFNRIMHQSGAQFPVAGIVIEDMDRNGRGNVYAFRNGVTVTIPSIRTATERLLTESEIASSFTDNPIITHAFARPSSTTRAQLISYFKAQSLPLPSNGTFPRRDNSFNELTRELYQQAWNSRQNHIIRAWVYAQRL